MTITRLLGSTALASALLLGTQGLVGAQGVNPGGSGSAGGGALAQPTTPGQPGLRSGSGSGTGMGSTGMGSTGASTSGATGPAQGATSGGVGTQSNRMGEDQLRTALRARGYEDISGLERDGDTYRVKEAKRYGEKVENLRIDASTGQVRDEKRLSEDQAKTLLRERGYSDVSDVQRDGDTISAKARRGDSEMRLRVDARSGAVTQQQASN